LIQDPRREVGRGVDVLLPDAKLHEQTLSFLERAGVESSFDLGVERMIERAQRVSQSSERRAAASRRSKRRR
jgi:hypothetical protein